MLADDRDAALAQPLFGALVRGQGQHRRRRACRRRPRAPRSPTRRRTRRSVVAALEAAGAIVVGKTNLDQFATGLVGTRSPYGAVPNAFDPRCISGGSSSGSAVAVAQGLVHFALGTDTAGSGRVPAGLNNIVGWKPTRGLLSTRGVVPACRSLDCVSIFALTVADAARVFAAAARRDDRRPRAARRAARPRRACATRSPSRCRARDQLEFFGDTRGRRRRSPRPSTRLDDAGRRRDARSTSRRGARWRRCSTKGRTSPSAMPASARSSTRTPTRSTRRCAGSSPARARFSATDVFVARRGSTTLQAQLAPLWSTRATCSSCRRRRRSTRSRRSQAEPVELNRRLGTYTNFVNLLDLAALAVPAAMRDDGLPFGITLIGPAGSDLMLADLAQRFHADDRPCRSARSASPMPAAERAAAARATTRSVAVVGAHLAGLPLNRELIERGARLVRPTRTAPRYRLYALPGTTPPKPGLRAHGQRRRRMRSTSKSGKCRSPAFGAFVAAIPAPLSIGTIELDDGATRAGIPVRSRRDRRRRRHHPLRRLARVPRARACPAAPGERCRPRPHSSPPIS